MPRGIPGSGTTVDKGVGITNHITIKEITDKISKLQVKLADKTPALTAVGIELQNVSRRAFRSEGTSLMGTKWSPLHPFTVGSRPESASKKKKREAEGILPSQRKHKILQNKGMLRNRIIKEVGKTSVKVGVAAGHKQDFILMFGGKIKVSTKQRYFLMKHGLFLRKETQYITIPARPYLGLESKTPAKLNRIIKEWADLAAQGKVMPMPKEIK
jgi:phage gpG-like protein